MSYVQRYSDLEVYKQARSLSKEIFLRTRMFPVEERYSLTDQIRRSSRSIGAQIAEAWGKRRYEMYFISKLTDADAEQMETQHWLEISEECGYLSTDDKNILHAKCHSIGRMLHNMIDKSSLFCKPQKKPKDTNSSS
ncbi:MAG: four helix bundle protein [Bacteroidota bacterium]